MAGAPTTVCFVKVDPSFQVVMNAINELHKNGRLQHVCTVTAGNKGLRSTQDNQQFGGGGHNPTYAFARTLGSVLRAFMLRSTYLEALHDPNNESKKSTVNINVRANQAGYNRNVQPQGVPKAQLPVTQDVVQAKKISADFDRLYPHFFIQNKLKKAQVDQGTEANLSGMMVIVELQGDDNVKLRIHTINTTVRAKQDPENPNKFECPDPNVVRITAAVLDLQDGQTDGDFPFFEALKGLLKAIVGAKIMPDEEIEALLEELKIDEKTSSDKDEKEEGEEVADLHLKTSSLKTST